MNQTRKYVSQHTILLVYSSNATKGNSALTSKKFFLFGCAHSLILHQKLLSRRITISMQHFQRIGKVLSSCWRTKTSFILQTNNFDRVKTNLPRKANNRQITILIGLPLQSSMLSGTVLLSLKTGQQMSKHTTRRRCLTYWSSKNH